MSINMHIPPSLSQVMMSGLLLGMILSVCTCWFHNTVTLPSWLVSTNFGTCSYQCSLSNFTPISCVTVTVVQPLAHHMIYGFKFIKLPAINLITQLRCFFCINVLCTLLIEQYCINM
jgi:hypothetical protein